MFFWGRAVLLVFVVGSLFVSGGCGQPNPPATATPTATPAPTKEPVAPPSVPSTPTNQSEPPVTTPPAAGESAKPASTANKSVSVATVKQIRELLDIRELPHLIQNDFLDHQLGNVSYSAKTSLAAAREHYTKELKSRGWQPLNMQVAATEQYWDQLFSKAGYYVKCTVSEDPASSQCTITLMNLGNLDTRQLPQPADAKIMQSEPQASSFQSTASLDQLVTQISESLQAVGWQVCEENTASEPNPEQFRSLKFRQAGVVVNIMLARNPTMEAGANFITYAAMPCLGIDIPSAGKDVPLQVVAAFGNKGIEFLYNFEFAGDRQALVELAKSQASKFGWEIKQTEDFVAKNKHELFADSGKSDRVYIRLMETKGKYYASFQAGSQKAVTPADPELKSTVAEENNAPLPDPSKKIIEGLDAELNKELQKTLKGLEKNVPGLELKLPMKDE